MKIEKITICNLLSIEGEYTVDFTKEPLRSANLFAVTGGIGAGKSTLLDGICLALYNRAPRFDCELFPSFKDDAADGSPLPEHTLRAVLCRGQKEAYCKVEFTGADGNLYESCWFLRVKRTDEGPIVTRTLRQLTPKKETFSESEVCQRVEEALGLNYQQFKRVILLEQGSFSNFLKAKCEEKSVLLEKLTGTDIYGEISRVIHQKCQQARQEYEALENTLKGIYSNRLASEDLAEAEEKLSFLNSNIKSGSEQLGVVEAQLQWYVENAQTEAKVSQCEAEYDAAHKAYVALRGEELELERYDAVLCVQPLYQEIIVRRNDIAAVKSQEDRLSSSLENARREVEETRVNLEGLLKNSVEAEARLAQRRSAINRGHELNGEISEARALLRTRGEEMRNAQVVMEQRTNQLNVKQQEYNSIQREIEDYQLHQQALSVHKLMFDRFDLIKDKLSMFNSESRMNAEFHKKAIVLQKRQKELALNRESVERQQQGNSERLSALKGELVIHLQTNRGHDSGLLQQRFADYRSRLIGLEHAAALWQRISVGYEAISEKKAMCSRHLSEQKQLQKDIERIERDVEILNEAYRRLNVAFTLSQSENMVQLRQQLKEGSACPVCGATHHPYHTETERELGDLLNNLEKEFTEAEEQLEAKRMLLADLRKQLAVLEGRILTETENLKEREQQQLVDIEEWKTCEYLDETFVDCSISVNRNARRLMIEMLLDNTRRAVGEAEQELNTFNFHQQNINKLNAEINALNVKITDDQSYLEDLRTQYKIITASLDDLQYNLQMSDRTCSQLYTDLDETVTLSGWFSEWKNNPDSFRMRLTSMYMDWLNTCKNLDECQRSTVILEGEIRSAEANKVDALGQFTSLHEAYEEAAQSLRNKEQEYKDLFPENTPEKEESLLQLQIRQAHGKVVDAREKSETAADRLSHLTGIYNNLVENRMKKQENFGKKTSELDLWILRFNGTHSPVQMQELGEIFTGGRDWNELRRTIDDRKKARALAWQNLESAREELLGLQSTPLRPNRDNGETPEELEENRLQLLSRLEDLRNQLSAVQLKINAHEHSLKLGTSCNDQRETVKANYEQWTCLADLLGSADGSKFRNLAQPYVLQNLVEHANIHLQKLSPRYLLTTVPGTLRMNVIDHDRLDQNRDFHSLTGGEIFVISLALALGLSSLLSNGADLGTLFVDEGNIYLEQQSLQNVMEVLSRLEMVKDRKIGVICRTNQISTQIHPQIRLEKTLGRGKSSLSIR